MKYIGKFENFEKINEVRVPRDERIQLYKDDNIIVIIPLTHRALIKYSSGCQWCINSDKWEWEEYHKGRHVIIIQRNPKTQKVGITGNKLSTEIFYIAKFVNEESTFDDVCQMLEFDFKDVKHMIDYYKSISKDINNFSTNIVYYSPFVGGGGVYDMEDNYLPNFNFTIDDVPNITNEINNIIINNLSKLSEESFNESIFNMIIQKI